MRLLIPAFIAALLTFSFQPKALAAEEYVIDAAFRTYSLGLVVSPSAGYRFPLWLEAESPFHGSIRPSVSVVASPVSIAGRLDLEFAPTRFFSLSAGQMFMNQFAPNKGEDCSANACIGNLSSTDLTARFQFLYGRFMGSARYTMTMFNSLYDATENTIDINSYVLLAPEDEVLTQFNAALAYSIFDEWSVGLSHQEVALKENSGTQNAQYLVVMKRKENLTYITGFGRYESELKPVNPSAFLSVKYTMQ